MNRILVDDLYFNRLVRVIGNQKFYLSEFQNDVLFYRCIKDEHVIIITSLDKKYRYRNDTTLAELYDNKHHVIYYRSKLGL